MSGFPINPPRRNKIESIIKNHTVHQPDALAVQKMPIFSTLKLKKEYTKEEKKLHNAINAIRYIMNNDKDCKGINKQALAEKIAAIAIDVGVHPEVAGAIIKQETHFSTDSAEMNKGTGIGPMQIVPIVIHDMFVRPEFYDPELKSIIGAKKEYKTFENALNAKLNNPKIDLGKFGNKFFEFYKQNKTYFDKECYKKRLNDLPKKIRNDYNRTLSNYDMNVYLGCFLYKAHRRTNSEKQAIINYNNSSIKYSYEAEVSRTIKQARKNAPEI